MLEARSTPHVGYIVATLGRPDEEVKMTGAIEGEETNNEAETRRRASREQG